MDKKTLALEKKEQTKITKEYLDVLSRIDQLEEELADLKMKKKS